MLEVRPGAPHGHARPGHRYRIDPQKADDLLEYDGSLILERTKGEIAARSHARRQSGDRTGWIMDPSGDFSHAAWLTLKQQRLNRTQPLHRNVEVVGLTA